MSACVHSNVYILRRIVSKDPSHLALFYQGFAQACRSSTKQASSTPWIAAYVHGWAPVVQARTLGEDRPVRQVVERSRLVRHYLRSMKLVRAAGEKRPVYLSHAPDQPDIACGGHRSDLWQWTDACNRDSPDKVTWLNQSTCGNSVVCTCGSSMQAVRTP